MENAFAECVHSGIESFLTHSLIDKAPVEHIDLTVCHQVFWEQLLKEGGPCHSLETCPEDIQALNFQAIRCGHVFGDGEPTYSCQDCGHDLTCVMCRKCFVVSEHRHHSYLMSVSVGGGCCDCGDEEAWREHAYCEGHQPKAGYNATPGLALQKISREAAASLFTSIGTIVRLFRRYVLDNNMTEDEASPSQCVLLNNDEVHDFQEVIVQLQRAVHASTTQARMLANRVDTFGRCFVFHTNEGIGECESVAQTLSQVPLNPKPLKTTIIPLEHMFKQDVATELVLWLAALCKDSDVVRAVMCGVLANRTLDQVLADDVGQSDDERQLGDLLIKFTRCWKRSRSAVRNLLFSSVILEQPYKVLLTADFVKCYDSIIQARMDDDHHHEESISILSVQLFTMPSLAQYAFKEHDALRVFLSTLQSVLSSHLSDDGILELEQFPLSKHDYWEILTDIHYLLVSDVGNILPILPAMLQFLKTQQGMHPALRRTIDHVHMESNVWKDTLTLAITTYSQTFPAMMRPGTLPSENLADAIKLCIEAICSSPSLVECPNPQLPLLERIPTLPSTLSSRISFHHPIQRLLVHFVIRFAKENPDASFDLQRILTSADKNGLSDESAWLAVFDPVMRLMCASGHISANMWVRNGMSMANQHYNYLHTAGRVSLYQPDLHMLQLAVTSTSPELIGRFLLKHFELDQWLIAPERANPDLVERVSSLCTSLLTLMTSLYAYRSAGVTTESADVCLEETMIQILCHGPAPFSQIKGLLPSGDNHNPQLTPIIRKIASTTRVGGQNCYQLNKEYLCRYNPGHIIHTGLDSSVARSYIHRTLAPKDKPQFYQPPHLPFPVSATFNALDNMLKTTAVVDILAALLQRAQRPASTSLDSPRFEYTCLSAALQTMSLQLAQAIAQGDAQLEELAQLYLAETPNGSLAQAFVQFQSNPPDSVDDLMRGHLAWIESNLLSSVSAATQQQFQTLGWKLSTEHVAAPAASKSKMDAKKKAEAARRKAMKKMKAKQKMFAQHASGDLAQAAPAPKAQVAGEEEFVLTCIHCQESAAPAQGEQFLYLAHMSNGTALLDAPECDLQNPMLRSMPPKIRMECTVSNMPEAMVTTCGHAMHDKCYLAFLKHQVETFSRLSTRDPREGNLQCPLCRQPCNLAMPVAFTQCSSESSSDSVPEMATSLADVLERHPPLERPEFAIKKTVDLIADVLQQRATIESLAIQAAVRNTMPPYPAFKKQRKASPTHAIVQAVGQSIVCMEQAETFREAFPTAVNSCVSKHSGMVLHGMLALAMRTSREYNLLDIWEETSHQLFEGDSVTVIYSDAFDVLMHTCLAVIEHGARAQASGADKIMGKPLWKELLQLCFLWCCTHDVLVVATQDSDDEKLMTHGAADDAESGDMLLQQALSDFSNVLVMGSDGQLPFHDGLDRERIMAALMKSCLTFGRRACFLQAAIFNAPVAMPDSIVGCLNQLDLPPLHDILRLVTQDVYRRRTLHFAKCIRLNLQSPFRLQPPSQVLVDLPSDYGDLFLQGCSAVCPVTHTPNKTPAMCLRCGEIVCSAGPCCSIDESASSTFHIPIGGCSQHASTCGCGYGLFLLIKKGSIFVHHMTQIALLDIPYMDEHGERSLSRRHGDLSLDPEMLAKLKYKYISHGFVPDIEKALDGFARHDGPFTWLRW
eukprot:m.20172 g.20172  ORF g.20172 m.20172 type:complete len:1667 (-) comp8132_c0_seq1:219-5219(-)